MFACSNFNFRLQLPLIIIHITCISLCLRRTSAPIHLTSVLGVLGTQVTSCILIAGLLERDIFDLFLPEFDKPLVIHLRETYFCSTNLCTWRPNTVYKNRSVRRHHLAASASRCSCRGPSALLLWWPGFAAFGGRRCCPGPPSLLLWSPRLPTSAGRRSCRGPQALLLWWLGFAAFGGQRWAALLPEAGMLAPSHGRRCYVSTSRVLPAALLVDGAAGSGRCEWLVLRGSGGLCW
jgi:hypothetical protein